jgi:transcriptional regulator with XRE-family HTH domain
MASASGMMDDELPRRLRAERERRHISVRELARRLEVTPSAISQIETGRARPSVATLFAIVTELDVSLDALFDHRQRTSGPGPRPQTELAEAIVRDEGREVLDLSTGVRWERLTADLDPEVEFLLVTYDVGGASSPVGQLMRHTGREYGLLLSGRLEITVGFETSELGPGDSISFDSTVPHRLANAGDEPVRAVWVVFGRHASDARTPRGF